MQRHEAILARRSARSGCRTRSAVVGDRGVDFLLGFARYLCSQVRLTYISQSRHPSGCASVKPTRPLPTQLFLDLLDRLQNPSLYFTRRFIFCKEPTGFDQSKLCLAGVKLVFKVLDETHGLVCLCLKGCHDRCSRELSLSSGRGQWLDAAGQRNTS